jgi:hypothetical protein
VPPVIIRERDGARCPLPRLVNPTVDPSAARPPPTSGSDSLLILAGTALFRAILHPGELIVATEAGAKTLAVRCARLCTVRRMADGPTVTHAEGHITFVPRR